MKTFQPTRRILTGAMLVALCVCVSYAQAGEEPVETKPAVDLGRAAFDQGIEKLRRQLSETAAIFGSPDESQPEVLTDQTVTPSIAEGARSEEAKPQLNIFSIEAITKALSNPSELITTSIDSLENYLRQSPEKIQTVLTKIRDAVSASSLKEYPVLLKIGKAIAPFAVKRFGSAFFGPSFDSFNQSLFSGPKTTFTESELNTAVQRARLEIANKKRIALENASKTFNDKPEVLKARQEELNKTFIQEVQDAEKIYNFLNTNREFFAP